MKKCQKAEAKAKKKDEKQKAKFIKVAYKEVYNKIKSPKFDFFISKMPLSKTDIQVIREKLNQDFPFLSIRTYYPAYRETWFMWNLKEETE